MGCFAVTAAAAAADDDSVLLWEFLMRVFTN
jgi:hypothetical protein